MPTASRSLAEMFRGVVDRMVAALHRQRAIEARRVLQRYHHLLRVPGEISPLNESISVRNVEEFSAYAHKSAARERSALRPRFERA